MGHIFLESFELLTDLERKFTSRDENKRVDLIGLALFLRYLKLLKCRKDKDGGLAHARLGLTKNVLSTVGLGDTLVLN